MRPLTIFCMLHSLINEITLYHGGKELDADEKRRYSKKNAVIQNSSLEPFLYKVTLGDSQNGIGVPIRDVGKENFSGIDSDEILDERRVG